MRTFDDILEALSESNMEAAVELCKAYDHATCEIGFQHLAGLIVKQVEEYHTPEVDNSPGDNESDLHAEMNRDADKAGIH